VRTCVSNRDTDPPIQKLLHAVDILCINYCEAFQRKKRANSWNDCHSRGYGQGVSTARARALKNVYMLGFRACNFNTSVWLQAGQRLALAAQIPAKQQSKKAAVAPCVSHCILPDTAYMASGLWSHLSPGLWSLLLMPPGPWQ
jgi:hypothetical protein